MPADVSQVLAIKAAFAARAANAPRMARAAVRKACLMVEAGAKQRAPVDTGFLRNSISTTVRDTKDGAVGEVGPTANYGGFVELGTSRMGPQPYLRPASDAVEPSFTALLEKLGEL